MERKYSISMAEIKKKSPKSKAYKKNQYFRDNNYKLSIKLSKNVKQYQKTNKFLNKVAFFGTKFPIKTSILSTIIKKSTSQLSNYKQMKL